MENGDEQQLAWLVNCLSATLDAKQEVRSAAEEALNQASLHQGYGVALAKVTVNKDLQYGLRQLAAVLLKQYVKQHWQEGEREYLPPTVSDADKNGIRELLLLALEDPHGKIRTAVGMAVASIASSDWPEDWPNLMNHLVGSINDKSNMIKVHGALRCLALFAGDLDDVQMPHLVPVLFPSLYPIVSSPTVYDPCVRRRALIILHSCISTLGVMSGAYQPQTKALMTPMLKAWMEQFALILSPPVPAENPEDWGLRMEVLKTLLQIVQHFPKLASLEFPVVLAPLWQTFVSGLKVYENASVQGFQESYAGLADSDGCEQGLEAFAIQLFEFLLALVGNPRFRKVMQSSINDLVYHTIGYMQMTEEQVQTWSADANQYVADEDDVTYSCRVSGVLLLDELVEVYDLQGMQAIAYSVQKQIEEADKYRTLGKPNWWKPREAAILAIGSVSEPLIAIQEKGNIGFSMDTFLDRILYEDLSTGAMQCPFLHGRASWAASKFAPLINKSRHEQFILAAMQGLTEKAPAPVVVGSCRALSQLLPQAVSESFRSHLGSAFAALGALLTEASDETLHLVLETIKACILADDQVTAVIESTLSPLLLNIWAQHASDPFISIDALEVLEAIKETAGCLEPLTARAFPFLARIFLHPESQPDGLVAAALDLLSMLLKNSPSSVVQAAHAAMFKSVVAILMHTDDHSELQNATECLTAFVHSGGEKLLSWGNEDHDNIQMLFDAAARLLNPTLHSSCSLFVGNFILQLIQQLSTQMAPHLRDLVAALIARMSTAEISGLKISLLLVFARMVHMSVPNVSQFVDLLASVPASGYDNSLAYVMSEWTAHQADIQGAFQIKVSTVALAHLLGSCDPRLSQIFVQGHLMQTNGSGIMTRSRSKITPDQWTTISLPSKILGLLAQSLMEIQEQGVNGFDLEEDDDWEEVSDEEEATNGNTMEPAKDSVFRPLEDMKHLLDKAAREEDDDDYQDDRYAATDPINQLNLSAYLVDFLKNFSYQHQALFDQLCKELSERERTTLGTALQT